MIDATLLHIIAIPVYIVILITGIKKNIGGANMKRIAVFLFTLMFLCVGSGCIRNSSLDNNKGNAGVLNLVVYLTDAAGEINAHKAVGERFRFVY